MVSELLQVFEETLHYQWYNSSNIKGSRAIASFGGDFAISEKSGILKNLGVYFYGDLNYPCPHSGVQFTNFLSKFQKSINSSLSDVLQVFEEDFSIVISVAYCINIVWNF